MTWRFRSWGTLLLAVVVGPGYWIAPAPAPRPRLPDQGSLGSTREEGLLLRFTFTEMASGWRVTAAELTALLTERDRSPVRLVDVARALADSGTDPSFRDRLAEAWFRTVALVDQRGATQSGLTPLPTV